MERNKRKWESAHPRQLFFFLQQIESGESHYTLCSFFVSSDIYWRSKTEMPNGLWLCEMKWEAMFCNTNTVSSDSVLCALKCLAVLSTSIHASEQENNMLFQEYIERNWGCDLLRARALVSRLRNIPHHAPPNLNSHLLKNIILLPSHHFFPLSSWKQIYFSDKNFMKIYIRASIFSILKYLYNNREGMLNSLKWR